MGIIDFVTSYKKYQSKSKMNLLAKIEEVITKIEFTK